MWFPSSTLFRRATPALLAFALLGCGDDSENGTTGPGASFSISAPATLSVEAGSSGTVEVTITRSSGFTDAVTLTLEDHSKDITHDSPAAYGTTVSTSVTFTVAAGMTPGTYPIKACGRAFGMALQCAEISLTVTPVSAGGGFTLSLNPASLTIEPGHTESVAVTLHRGAPFAGYVTLDIATFSQHPGVTFSFDPAIIPAGATTATLTISVAADAKRMEYAWWNTLWVAGISGHLRHDVLLRLTVADGFTLSLDPAFLWITPGQTGMVGITLTRASSFTGPVALDIATLSALPGVTFSFDPAVIPAGATSAWATIKVAADAAPVLFEVWIVGLSGSAMFDVPLHLMVRAP